MPSLDEWREMLGNPLLTDAEVAEFVDGLRQLLGRFLDDYLRDDLGSSEV